MASIMKQGSLLATSCGSPHYASPEIVRGDEYNGMESDVWSCGVILFALVTGRLPFDDENLKKLLCKVKTGVFVLPKFIPPDLGDLIQKMLTIDPRKRITLSEIKGHPWLAKRSVLDWPRLSINQNLHIPIAPHEIDESILVNLRMLGWEDDELVTTLSSHEKNMPKVFYHLLEERSQVSTSSIYRTGGHRMQTPSINIPRHQRCMSDMLTEPKSSTKKKHKSFNKSSGRRSENNAHHARTPSVQLQKPLTMRDNVDEDDSPIVIQQLKNSPTITPPKDEYPSSPIVGSSPKKSWFSYLFGSPKSQPVTNFGFHVSRSYGSVMAELSRSFLKLDLKVKVTPPKFKAKYYKDGKMAVKLLVEAVQLEQDIFVKFVQISGKSETFALLCNRIKAEMLP